MISIVVAKAENNVIGAKNTLPWRLSNDLKRFARLTRGHTVVMGRKTFESIINRVGVPLQERRNIVLTRDPNFKWPGVEVIHSEEELKQYADSAEEVFVIGGEQVYALALPLASRLYLTIVHGQIAGDAFFPAWNEAQWELKETERFPKDEKNNYETTFIVYERKNAEAGVKNRFIEQSNTRREDQKKVMAEIADAGHCPFCPENLLKYHKKPILKEGRFWILTDNQWPYEKIKNQLLAIYKTHIEHLEEMDPEAGKELIELFQEEASKRSIPGGGLAMRFGKSPDGNYGSSVLHIHAHLVEPDLKALASDEAWRFKFGQPKNYKSKK